MKRILCIALAVCGLGIGTALLAPDTAAATPKSEICQGVSVTPGGGCSGGTKALNGILKTIIQLFASVIGIAAVIMIMVAGLKYVTAGGDSGKVGDAKKTILYAVIGLVIAAAAQAIVWFVINKASVAANKDSYNTSVPAPSADIALNVTTKM